MTGMLLLGLLANPSANPLLATTYKIAGQSTLLTGSVGQLFNQIKGAFFTVVLAGGATLILLKIVDRLVGLRVDEDEESLGLDLSQHGEKAYND